MKDLLFSITLNNHTFYIRTNNRTTLCSYNLSDKYTTSLVFASNTFARVTYKNIMFSGKVTKQDIWHIYLDCKLVVEKYYSGYHFMNRFIKTAQNESNHVSLELPTPENNSEDYPKHILYLYNELINDLSEHYNCINDKIEFRTQLCDDLCNLYELDNIEDLDVIVEYENRDDIGPDEDPIIEETTLRNYLINEYKEYFIAFHQAELDNKNKKSIITLENVVKEVTELQKIPHDFLQKEFEAYLDKTYEDLISVSIDYCQADELYGIGIDLYRSYQYFIFINTMNDKIDKILAEMKVDYIDKNEIYSYFKTKYNKENIPGDKEFKESVMSIINDHVTFYHTYEKFFSLFNSNYIEIEWDDDTIRLFQKYEQRELDVAPEHIAEFEVYKHVIPLYRQHFFRKNSTKYKPTIEKLPDFISYASTVLDILFKHNVFIDTEDDVFYNENGDIDSALEEIKKTSTS